jgi:DNA-binding response OmpR family regulator
MGSRILLVEGRGAKALSCAALLEEKDYAVNRVHTRRNTYAQLEKLSPDLLIIDARCLRFNAHRVCQTLHENGNRVPLLLLLPEDGKEPDSSTAVILRGKVTPRKILNRVKRLLSKPGGEILRAGEVTLDLKRRIVTKGRQQHRLTPKQAHLLEVFIRNPGRVLTRAILMRKVWDTDFVGDTRTLEVHVHWLRKAIEDDPSQPVYITTVRRLGYRFDVP